MHPVAIKSALPGMSNCIHINLSTAQVSFYLQRVQFFNVFTMVRPSVLVFLGNYNGKQISHLLIK